MTVQKYSGWAVEFHPEGRLAIEGGETPLPWVRRTRQEAREFAKGLDEHGVNGGKPVRVSVSVSFNETVPA